VSTVVQHINNLKSHGSKYVMSDRSQSIGKDGFTGGPRAHRRRCYDFGWIPTIEHR
jgi:hypothetical protein